MNIRCGSSHNPYYSASLKGFKRFKGRLVGLFQHCSWRLIVLLPPMSSFIHLQRRHALYRRERPLLANELTKVLGSFTCRKAGIWDRFFHFPSEGRHAEDYSDTRKMQQIRPGSNTRTRVPEASMLTTRPRKPLILSVNMQVRWAEN